MQWNYNHLWVSYHITTRRHNPEGILSHHYTASQPGRYPTTSLHGFRTQKVSYHIITRLQNPEGILPHHYKASEPRRYPTTSPHGFRTQKVSYHITTRHLISKSYPTTPLYHNLTCISNTNVVLQYFAVSKYFRVPNRHFCFFFGILLPGFLSVKHSFCPSPY
jgi:hypothetical protein